MVAFDEVAVVIGGVTKGRNLRGKKTLICPYLSVANVQRGYFKLGRDYIAGAAKQTTNLASINMTQLRGFPLPVPPLDEQRRILEKLAELIARCNIWRDQLDRKAKLSVLLASVAISSLTGLEIEQDEKAALKALQKTN